MQASKMLFIEPYRLFFPLGVLSFLFGILIWLPQIWNPGSYPVILHRYLMLNGFSACFIGGFLMTAVPKFSETKSALKTEVFVFLFVTLGGVIPAFMENERISLLLSSLQPFILLIFLFSRIFKRKQNPPYSFIFIFVGLILWLISGLHGALVNPETLKRLHYEGAIAAIILGVGSRLIPGILGHTEIVMKQRSAYEKPISILKTLPLHFAFVIFLFAGSYFFDEGPGNWVRAVIVVFISIYYWKLYKFPRERSTLTWSIWICAWLISLSFLLRAYWHEGLIHASHSFFINGIALLSFLIATRVLQSHGPQDKSLENKKILYLITFFVILAA
ncbi:MAG: NnrS family protein, partial [Bacteriovoracia bacterium]